jgi:hypothetical protein
MIHDILTAAALPHRDGSSPANLPAKTFVYVFDTVTLDGPDRTGNQIEAMPCIAKHQVRLEMYSPEADPASEAIFETQMLCSGLLYTKTPREWVPSVQRYLVTYNTNYTLKI